MTRIITAQPGQVVITLYGDGVVKQLVYLGNDRFEWREVRK